MAAFISFTFGISTSLLHCSRSHFCGLAYSGYIIIYSNSPAEYPLLFDQAFPGEVSRYSTILGNGTKKAGPELALPSCEVRETELAGGQGVGHVTVNVAIRWTSRGQGRKALARIGPFSLNPLESAGPLDKGGCALERGLSAGQGRGGALGLHHPGGSIRIGVD